MASIKVFKPTISKNDIYQSSQSTQYKKDQTTGELFPTSGQNVKTIIPEMFKSAEFMIIDNSATSGTNHDIYAVGAGKIFILIGASLSTAWEAAHAIGDTGYLRITINGGVSYDIMIRASGHGGAVGSSNFMFNPNVLMVFDETYTFNVRAITNCYATATIMGYLIDKSEYFPAS